MHSRLAKDPVVVISFCIHVLKAFEPWLLLQRIEQEAFVVFRNGNAIEGPEGAVMLLYLAWCDESTVPTSRELISFRLLAMQW